jgi:hypothetical protein
MPRLIEAVEAERQGVGTQPHGIRGDAGPIPRPKNLGLKYRVTTDQRLAQ